MQECVHLQVAAAWQGGLYWEEDRGRSDHSADRFLSVPDLLHGIHTFLSSNI